jgi:glycosyltransferase involved in cell wall biosynthesis
MKISIIQPSRNNLKYLKWSYDAIRRNQGEHTVEICVADDFSDKDGTWNWCLEMMEKDPLFKAIRNEGPARLGHTILYDRLVNEVASFDICMIYHADMYLCPSALNAIETHIGPKKIVSLTRIEPPLHPPGPEKILLDCGIEPEQFDEDKLLHHLEMEYDILHEGKTTEGIFAPWAFMKSDFQEIGGHDPLYAPQSKEDSDIFNRFQLNGVQFIQTWEGFVYHMTCRGSRFNPSLTTPGQNSSEWEAQNMRSTRNFIRKWGHFVKHDEFMKPMIPSKYNIAFVVKNCNQLMLSYIEPWGDRTYIEDDMHVLIDSYIELEQPNTLIDLSKRLFHISHNDPYGENDIVVEFDATRLTREDYNNIQSLSEILDASDLLTEFSEPGEEFQLGNLKITIYSVQTYQQELINI